MFSWLSNFEDCLHLLAGCGQILLAGRSSASISCSPSLHRSDAREGPRVNHGVGASLPRQLSIKYCFLFCLKERWITGYHVLLTWVACAHKHMIHISINMYSEEVHTWVYAYVLCGFLLKETATDGPLKVFGEFPPHSALPPCGFSHTKPRGIPAPRHTCSSCAKRRRQLA